MRLGRVVWLGSRACAVTFSAPARATDAGDGANGRPTRGYSEGSPLCEAPLQFLCGTGLVLPGSSPGFAPGYVLSAILLTLFAAATGNLKHLSALTALAVPPWWVTIAGLVGLWIGFIGAIVIACRSKGTGNPIRDLGLKVKLVDIPVGIVIGVVGQLVVDFLYLPFEHLDPGLSKEFNAPANKLTGGFHGADLVVIAVLTVAVVPVIEETFFRGLVLQSLVRIFRGAGRKLGPVLSVVSTGILFGLAHAEPLQLGGLALFGVVLCILAYRTGRLGPSMFAHAAFNGFAVIAIATQGRIVL